MEEFILTDKPNLESARKDVGTDGSPYNIGKDSDDTTRVSEWAWAYALMEWNEGDTITEAELNEAISVAVTQQLLDHMIDEGLIEAVMPNNDDGDVGYRLTPLGRVEGAKLIR
jgi:hypothetical protein